MTVLVQGNGDREMETGKWRQDWEAECFILPPELEFD